MKTRKWRETKARALHNHMNNLRNEKKKYKKGEEEIKTLTKTETMAQPTHSHQGEVCLDVKMKTFGVVKRRTKNIGTFRTCYMKVGGCVRVREVKKSAEIPPPLRT